MSYFKKLFNNTHYVEEYPTFQDYLGVTQLPIYMDGLDNQPPALLGYVPRISEVWSDSDMTMVRLTYPMGSVVGGYKKDLFVQFNGTDVCIAKREPKQELLCIPMTVYTHLDDQIIDTSTYDVPILYGVTHIVHIIPSRDIALSAVENAEKKYHGDCSKLSLTLKHWEFIDGELHVYAKLPDEIQSWIRISTTGIPDDDHLHILRYTPQPVFLTDAIGCMYINLRIDDDDARDIVEKLLPPQKYRYEMEAVSVDGIDELNVTRTIRTDQFPESYGYIKPFADYLNHLGYCVDDDILYDYFATQKGNSDSTNG